MKLIRCHIEGFGGFCQEDFVFDAHLTEFCKKNGWGKTTLADFISAMLYGLPTTKENSAFGKRQRYLPFNGGKFGGTLVLEVDGKEWRIERTFHNKSETKDTLTVYCGTETVPMGRSEVGFKLLGVDESTFARVSLIGDEQLDIGDNNGELGSKLQATLDDTADSYPYESIVATLGDLIKELQPQRRNQNNPGKIPLSKEKIRQLEQALQNQRAIADSLPSHYAEHRAIGEQIDRIDAQLAAIGAYKLRRQKWETYQGYLQEALEAQNELSFLMGKYPAGFPSQEELEQLKKLNDEKIALDARRGMRFDDESGRFATLTASYPDGLPSAEAIGAAYEQLEIYKENERGILFLESEAEGDLDEQTRALFALGVPSQEELDKMDALAGEIHAIDEKLQADTAAQTALTTKKKPVGLIGGLIGGGVILSAVGGALAAGNVGAGVVLLVLGIGLLIGGILVAVLQKGSGVDHNRMFALQSEKNEKIEALRKLLITYRLGVNPLADYARLISALESYRQHTERLASKEARLAAYRQKMGEAGEKLAAFIGRYLTPGNSIRADLDKISHDAEEMDRLTQEQQRRSKSKQSLEDEAHQNVQAIAHLIAQYQLVVITSLSECIEELQRDFTSYQEIQRKCEELRQKAEKYGKEERLSTEPAPVAGDEEVLKTEKDRLYQEKADKWRDIEAYESEIADMVEREEALAAEKERLGELEERLNLLTLTREMIEQAEKNIVDRYVGPVRQTLTDYLGKVELVLGESLTLDKNFSLQYETGGVLHPEGHLSAGQRALCGLCFRLAILPHLYQGKTPFVLLDDPFATVDEAYMDKARVMLKELSQEMQIVYFCCHESRSLQ